MGPNVELALKIGFSDQITRHCEEQGVVLGAIWKNYTSILENVMLAIRQQCSETQIRFPF